MYQFKKNLLFNGCGEILSRVPFVLTEIYIAKHIGVGLYGVWTLVQLCVNYNNFSHFGLLSGLAKLEPLNINGKTEYLNNIRSAAFYPVFMLDLVALMLLFLFDSFGVFSNEVSKYIYSLSALLFTQQLFLYGQVRLQNMVNFKLLAIGKLVYSFTFMCMVFSSPNKIDLHYLIFAWGFSFILTSTIIYYRARLLPVFSVNLLYIKKLFFVGFPIFLMGVIKLFLTSFDKFILISFYSLSDLGAYNISFQAMMLMTMVIGLLSRVFTPIFLRSYASNSKQSLEFFYGVKKKSFFLGVSVASLCSIAFIFIVECFLVEYKKGIVPGLFLIFSGIYQGGFQITISAVVAKNKENSLLYFYAIFGFVYMAALIFLAYYTNSLWVLSLVNLVFWVSIELAVSTILLGDNIYDLVKVLVYMLAMFLFILCFYLFFGFSLTKWLMVFITMSMFTLWAVSRMGLLKLVNLVV